MMRVNYRLATENKKRAHWERVFLVAGRAGFEPATGLTQHSLSRRAHSATLAPPQFFVVATSNIRLVAQGQLLKLSLLIISLAEGVGFEPTLV